MDDKLDAFNKILLATGSINYMSSALNGVNLQMVCLPDPDGYHKEGIAGRYEILNEVADNLYKIMEILGDFMNDTDCISPIDIRATKEAFIICSGENDLVNTDNNQVE
jgi:hypothetical protein